MLPALCRALASRLHGLLLRVRIALILMTVPARSVKGAPASACKLSMYSGVFDTASRSFSLRVSKTVWSNSSGSSEKKRVLFRSGGTAIPFIALDTDLTFAY